MSEERFTFADLVACAEREVRQRQNVYPRLIENGKLSQDFADRQVAMMQEIAKRLRLAAAAETATTDLFGGSEGVRP